MRLDQKAHKTLLETQRKHWWATGRRQIFSSIIQELKLSSDARILECGCGSGGNLQMLSAFGTVAGFELDAQAMEIAAAESSEFAEVVQGSFPDDVPFSGRTFDLICLFDVLEHLEDDSKALEVLNDRLSEKGKILISVPAFQWMWGVHDEFFHHKRRYSWKSLSAIVPDAFSICRLSYFNTFLFPIAFAVRMMEKLVKAEKSSSNGTPPKVVNNLLAWIFGSERYFLKHLSFPVGVSLLCILEKSEKAS